MYTYECAPIATLIELECIKKMCNMVGPGFEEASGVFTTGSSMGNLYGLLCARQRKYPEIMRDGQDGRKFVVFVSEECHYSCNMSANVLGLGQDNLVKVAVDEYGAMDTVDLEAKIKQA